MLRRDFEQRSALIQNLSITYSTALSNFTPPPNLHLFLAKSMFIHPRVNHPVQRRDLRLRSALRLALHLLRYAMYGSLMKNLK